MASLALFRARSEALAATQNWAGDDSRHFLGWKVPDMARFMRPEQQYSDRYDISLRTTALGRLPRSRSHARGGPRRPAVSPGMCNALACTTVL